MMFDVMVLLTDVYIKSPLTELAPVTLHKLRLICSHGSPGDRDYCRPHKLPPSSDAITQSSGR